MKHIKNLTILLPKKSIVTSIVLIALVASSSIVSAQVYKYRKPNGKLLFTDSEVFITGFVLLNPEEIVIEPTPRPIYKTNPLQFQSYIEQASIKFRVEEALIKAIIKAESGFNPNALSKAGAQGLMQLMPTTAKVYKVQNSYNSKQNIMAGTEHMKYLLGKYKNNLTLALAAYNAGETAVNQHSGIPPYPETQRYVKKVFKFKKEFESQ
jgi:soluble lytic murein transglycosylase-like protein